MANMELFPGQQSHISRPRQVVAALAAPGWVSESRRDGHVAARLTPQGEAKKDSGGYEVAA